MCVFRFTLSSTNLFANVFTNTLTNTFLSCRRLPTCRAAHRAAGAYSPRRADVCECFPKKVRQGVRKKVFVNVFIKVHI